MAISLQSMHSLSSLAQGSPRQGVQQGTGPHDEAQTGEFAQAWPAGESAGERLLPPPYEVSTTGASGEPDATLAQASAESQLAENQMAESQMASMSSLALLVTPHPLHPPQQGFGFHLVGAFEAEPQAMPWQALGSVAGQGGGSAMSGAPLSLLVTRLTQQSQAASPTTSRVPGESASRPEGEGSPLPLVPEARALVRKGELEALLSQLQDPLGVERKEGAKPVVEMAQLASPQEPLRAEPLLSQVGKGMEWAPMKLANPQSQWGEQMLSTLKERVEMQVNQHIKQAHIRLDPPDLGRLELTVRLEGDRLSVQLNAANPALRDALIQSSERLRMSLMPQHAGGVDVNVGQGDHQRQGQSQEEESRILAGRRELRVEETKQAARGLDRLNALV